MMMMMINVFNNKLLQFWAKYPKGDYIRTNNNIMNVFTNINYKEYSKTTA